MLYGIKIHNSRSAIQLAVSSGQLAVGIMEFRLLAANCQLETEDYLCTHENFNGVPWQYLSQPFGGRYFTAKGI
jgi:hypothetical protein